MQTFTHSLPGRALAVLIIASMLGVGCGPGFLSAVPGSAEYHRFGFIEVPGGVYNAPAVNLMLPRSDISLDTPLWTQAVGAVFNSANARWHWSFETRYDGVRFVDPSGARHDVGGLSDGRAIPGTHWVRVDADTMKTKGGQTYHFDAQGRIDHLTWANTDHPRVAYVWSETTLEQRLCTSDVPISFCSLLFTIELGDSGPTTVVDEISNAAGAIREVHYGYDARGRLERVQGPFERAQGLPGTRYEYHGVSDRIFAMVSPEGERIEYTWNGHMLDSVTRVGRGNPTHTFTHHQTTEAPRIYTVVHRNPLGGETAVRFDGERRTVEVNHRGTGERRSIAWEGSPRRPSAIVDFDGTTTEYLEWLDDDPTKIREPSGNVLRLAYEPDGVDFSHPLQRPLAYATDELGVVRGLSYDALGRPRLWVNGELEVTRTTYTPAILESLELPHGATVQYTSYGRHGHWLDAELSWQPDLPLRRRFDAVGNPTVPAFGRQEGGTLEQVYDAGRHLQKILVAAMDSTGAVGTTGSAQIERRSDGRLLRVIRPGGAEHRFEYDDLGRLERLRERVDGTWQDTRFEHDALGHVTAEEKPNGMRSEFSFDAYGRLTGRRVLRDGVLEGEAIFVWEDGHIVASFDSLRDQWETVSYDSAGRPQHLTYSALGETLTLSYDIRSRLTSRLYRFGDLAREIRYAWDLANRRSRVYTVGANGVEQELNRFVYEQGRLVSIEYGNGLSRHTIFDPETGRLQGYRTVDSRDVRVETTTIATELKRDPSRLQLTSTTRTPLASTREEYWLNRGGSLQTLEGKIGMRIFRWRGWLNGVLEAEQAYAWDELSNPTDTADGDVFTYNAERNRLLSADLDRISHAYTYDEAGFATSRDGIAIAWNAVGLVRRIGPASDPLAEIAWDLGGRPISVTALGEVRSFVLFGGAVEYDAATGMLGALHLVHGSLPFVGEERRYRHFDALGNVSFVSDEGGRILTHKRYRPFGVDKVLGGDDFTSDEPRGFAGGIELRHDGTETGLVVLGARILDSHVGRFLSPDPVFHHLNQYTYAQGNPVLYTDPDGRQAAPRVEAGAAALELQAARLEAAAANLEEFSNVTLAAGFGASAFLAARGALVLAAVVGALGTAFGASLDAYAASIRADAAALRAEAAAIRAIQAAIGAARALSPTAAGPGNASLQPAPARGAPPAVSGLAFSVSAPLPVPQVCGPPIDAPDAGGDAHTTPMLLAVLCLVLFLLGVEVRRADSRRRR